MSIDISNIDHFDRKNFKPNQYYLYVGDSGCGKTSTLLTILKESAK